MFTHCLRFLRRERRLWSPWKLWLANGGCFLPDRMTCCLLRWALKLAVGVSTHNFHSKKKKKRSRNQEKCITRGSIYAQDKCLLFGCTLHMFVETSNTPRVIFKYVDAVNNKNFNFITVEMFGFMILEVLWQHYETGSALNKFIHLYFFFNLKSPWLYCL